MTHTKIKRSVLEAMAFASELHPDDEWYSKKSGKPVIIQSIDRKHLKVRILHSSGLSSKIKIQHFKNHYTKEQS